MTSKTTAMLPIVSALAHTQRFGKAESSWTPNGVGAKEQERYIPLITSLNAKTNLFAPEELKSIASSNVDEINSFLKENGFAIQLPPFVDPNDFGVASTMSVLVKWIVPGSEYSLLVGEKTYDAARLNSASFYRVGDYKHPVVKLGTENGDTVHLTMADRNDLSGLDLLEKVKSLTAVDDDEVDDWGAVVFPMVTLDQEVDINFFLQMGFHGTGSAGDKGFLKILHAMQQTKFKMNHLGAKAESAAAFALGFECISTPKPDLIINQAFYVWMTRPGLDEPYFAGYIDPSDWKDPGALK